MWDLKESKQKGERERKEGREGKLEKRRQTHRNSRMVTARRRVGD